MSHYSILRKNKQLLLLPISMESDPYTTIVFCGGSSKCISFCGALRYLREHAMLDNINHVMGVSAGSLIGLFYILGYTPDEIIYEVNQLNSECIFGQELSVWSLPGAIYSLINNLGISDGKKLREKVRALFSRKGIPFSVTFSELYDKFPIKFTVTATNIHYREMKAFNYMITPHIEVVRAMQASMCLPFIFQPVNIDGELYIDGGMKDNLPISLTREHEKTLALKLETDEELDIDNGQNINYSFIKFISDILDTLFSNVWPDSYNDSIELITINIPYMSMLNFDLSTEEVQELINSGYDSMRHKFQYYSRPININVKSKHYRKCKGSRQGK